jgi:putative membrane protein
MGVCDLIPGISGGTIAFITGIYERLIEAVSNITFKNYYNLFFNSSKRKKLFEKLDIIFLLSLFSGIFFAIIIGSKFISYFIENYYVYVFSFFTGLILASGLFISKQIDVKNNLNKSFGVLGFFLGIILLLFSPQEINSPSFLITLISGFFAIFALFLPGISGSFILVIFGMYEYIINLVKSFDLVGLIPFFIGAGLGVVIISRVVKFLFKFDKSKTLFFLLGLVLGTLSIPIRNIYLSIETFSFGLIFNFIVLAVFGFWCVKKLERL